MRVKVIGGHYDGETIETQDESATVLEFPKPTSYGVELVRYTKRADGNFVWDGLPDPPIPDQPEPVSQIVLTFPATGYAEFASTKVENVTPMQMLAAAEWMRWQALNTFNEAAAAAKQRPQIARPSATMPLHKFGRNLQG